MTFDEANSRIGYEYSAYYGYELDPKYYDTKEEYEKALAKDEKESKEAWKFFDIAEQESICEHCYYANCCEVYNHLNDRGHVRIITSCNQAVHEDCVPEEEDTRDWSYEDWSKGR